MKGIEVVVKSNVNYLVASRYVILPTKAYKSVKPPFRVRVPLGVFRQVLVEVPF